MIGIIELCIIYNSLSKNRLRENLILRHQARIYIFLWFDRENFLVSKIKKIVLFLIIWILTLLDKKFSFPSFESNCSILIMNNKY